MSHVLTALASAALTLALTLTLTAPSTTYAELPVTAEDSFCLTLIPAQSTSTGLLLTIDTTIHYDDCN